MKGGHPPAFDDALNFTQAIIDKYDLDLSKVFVSGHSLGGAEAEYVASQALIGGDDGLLGPVAGASFGAPGINPGVERPATAFEFNFKNYIDVGDPVAKYNDHYGENIFVGGNLPNAARDAANANLIDSTATQLLHDAVPDPLLTPFLIEIAATTHLNVGKILQQHHALAQYDALI